MSIRISERQMAGGIVIVDLCGCLTLEFLPKASRLDPDIIDPECGYAKLKAELLDLATKWQNKILLNLGEVSYIDSSGIGELVSGFTTVTNSGGQLKLLGLNKRVKDLLQITKLYNVFDVHEDEAAAIRSFA